jgi:predicted short-subunit dehydrogenase-like oxidoreductase (DUF2520 family)
MKKSTSVGLIASGNLTDSPLSRFRWLTGRLGPVKSQNYRLASRIANILAAGHPVKDYAELDPCGLILVCVPGQALPKIVAELLSSEIQWRGKALVLCSTWLDSAELCELSARGAAIGSISPIPGFDETRYLIEGDRLAIREARSLVEDRDRRAIDIERPLKPFYLAALSATGTLLFTLLLAASECLRHAGIPASFSATILDRQLSKTLRAFIKGGRHAYPTLQELPKQLRALSSANPALAHYIEQSSRLASRLMEKR